MVVNLNMETKSSELSTDAAEQIIQTALAAFERGAGRVPLSPQAVRSFREQFTPRVYAALERPDWQSDWHCEKVYLQAYAEAMGRRARMVAADDRRTSITALDIEEAVQKLRGYMPIAGRWCPL